MLFKRYTKEQLIEAVKTSTSIRQVLIKLNIDSYGGNYRTINKYIIQLELDTSHFLGQGWNKGNSPNIYQDRTTKDYLDNKYQINSHKLKQRMFRENYFEKKCYKCGLTEWNGQPISLELEHIDGNHLNNNLSNLTILCPNCHSQTPTYRRQKTSSSLTGIPTKHNKPTKVCECGNKMHFYSKQCIQCSNKSRRTIKQCICGQIINKTSNMCSKCHQISTRVIERPSYEQLKQELSESNYCAVARKYCVSDNAIRKWIKWYERDLNS